MKHDSDLDSSAFVASWLPGTVQSAVPAPAPASFFLFFFFFPACVWPGFFGRPGSADSLGPEAVRPGASGPGAGEWARSQVRPDGIFPRSLLHLPASRLQGVVLESHNLKPSARFDLVAQHAESGSRDSVFGDVKQPAAFGLDSCLRGLTDRSRKTPE